MNAFIKSVIQYVMAATRTLVVHVWLPAVFDEIIYTPLLDFLNFVNEELPPDDNITSMEADNEGGGGPV